MLTPLEFSKKTRIPMDNFIFDNLPDNSKFYMYKAVKNRLVDAPERYCFNNGTVIYEFKHMDKYGETWVRVFNMTVSNPEWSLWSTWNVWD